MAETIRSVLSAPYPPGSRFQTRGELYRFALRLFFLLVALVAPIMFLRANWSRTGWDRDTVPIHVAARRIQDGKPLYPGPSGYTPLRPALVGDRLAYPPFLPAAVSWAADRDFPAFTRLFYVADLLAVLVYAIALARIATGRVRPLDVGVAAGAVFASPLALGAMSMGNPEPILWALYSLAIAFPVFRGAGFLMAGSVKLFGFWPLAVAAVRDRRRTLISASVAALALAALGIGVLGAPGLLQAMVNWFRYSMPESAQGSFFYANVSVSFAVVRLARHLGWQYTGGPLPLLARIWLFGAGVTAPLVTGWMTRNRSTDVQCAAVLVAALAFSPICWSEYSAVLLLPGALWLRVRARLPEPEPAQVPPESVYHI